MNISKPGKQRGITLSGLIAAAFVLVLVVSTGLKLVPAYIENAEIQKIFNEVSNDPAMQKASLSDIRLSYARRASIDNIQAIKLDDIDVDTSSGKPVLSASYFVKVPLAGNISFYLDFNPVSGKS
jgi:hypothetical protein